MFEEPEEQPRSDWEIAETLYQKGWEYYMNNCSVITSEKYKVMQEQIGFPETYEEHMKRLTQGIPNDTSRMVKQILAFLEKYPVFKHQAFPKMIDQLLEKLKDNAQLFEQAAFKALIEANAERDPDDPIAEDLSQHPPLFETQVGNDTITLPTYGNPIMTALYSLLFVLFSHLNAP